MSSYFYLGSLKWPYLASLKRYQLAQMKATDIRNKTSPYSGQNPRRLDLSFLVIYGLVTRGHVAHHHN